jgi:hypothetical protein
MISMSPVSGDISGFVKLVLQGGVLPKIVTKTAKLMMLAKVRYD